MKKLLSKNATKLVSSLATGVMLLGMVAQTASAAILFQDDTFADVESDAIRIGSNDAGAVNTAIQFGNDSTSSENGVIQWNIGTNSFSVDHTVDITGGLSATGQVNFSGARGTRLRESSSPNTLAACATLNEVIINTTANRLEVCTTTGVAGVAVWTAPAPAVPTGATNPVTCAAGQLFFNTTSATLQVCTATNTWNTAGPQDFEAVYGYDADKKLTTTNGAFEIARGSGAFTLSGTGTTTLNQSTLSSTSTGAMTLTGGAASTINTTAGNLSLSSDAANLNLTGGGSGATAVNIQASNAAGGITANWGTGGLNFSSTTGAFSVSGTGASTVNATSGNLSLTTTTSGNIALNSAGNITFDDATITSPIKFTNTDTALNATFPAGAGILDALNSFTSTASGSGASNVGINDSGNYFTGTDVESALQELGAVSGANAPNNDVLTFDPQYPDYVLFRDGTNNSGTLVQDYDNTSSINRQYYGWTTNNPSLSDIDVKFRFPLPADFASTGNFTLAYITGTAAAANNKVDVTVSNSTDLTAGAPTACGSSTGLTSTTWATTTITAATLNAGCTGGTALNAGDIVEVDVKLYDINGATTFARASTAALAYNN